MKSSRGEIKIYEVLDKVGVDFVEEYSFDDLLSHLGKPLRFDFCVFDDDGEIAFLIEFQGEQHYKPKTKFGGYQGFQKQLYNDKKKIDYCKKHGYKLVAIPYYEEELIDYDYIMNKVNSL